MTLDEFITKTNNKLSNRTFNVRPAIYCDDGFTVSVQASEGHYCNPKINNSTKYSEFELGFPSETEELILPFIEGNGDPTETVYGWVPADTLIKVINKHGGIDINRTFKK